MGGVAGGAATGSAAAAAAADVDVDVEISVPVEVLDLCLVEEDGAPVVDVDVDDEPFLGGGVAKTLFFESLRPRTGGVGGGAAAAALLLRRYRFGGCVVGGIGSVDADDVIVVNGCFRSFNGIVGGSGIVDTTDMVGGTVAGAGNGRLLERFF